MLLTITNTHAPATDLGYLLHKNPARLHTYDLTAGKAHLFYPEATEASCTVALLLDIDPIALVRGRRSGKRESGFLDQYVNDRPYVASSFMSVAIGKAFSTALSGRSKERQALADTPLPLTARLTAVPSSGGEELLRRIFEPLGYTVELEEELLDSEFPEWGSSPYYTLTLGAKLLLKDLLSHLYVLIPVLDDAKHYWVGEDEVEKLLRRGERWLSSHPEKELITRRYLFHQRQLCNDALARLLQDEPPLPEQSEEVSLRREERRTLNQHRIEALTSALLDVEATSVMDLGCGEGKLLKRLLEEPGFERIIGMDVSSQALLRASRYLQLESMPDRQRKRLELFQGSLLYRDKRLEGVEAAVVAEVIEHMDTHRLKSFEKVLFHYARPKFIFLSTPNADYNALFESLPNDELRHPDHRFEWTREEFESWAKRVAQEHGYDLVLKEIGESKSGFGSPTQLAMFSSMEKEDACVKA